MLLTGRMPSVTKAWENTKNLKDSSLEVAIIAWSLVIKTKEIFGDNCRRY
jgi:hypothetical protein